MRVVRRGFDEVSEIADTADRRAERRRPVAGSEPTLPVMLKRAAAERRRRSTDIHRFWEQTGSFYARGKGNDNLTDPFIGLGVHAGRRRRCSAT